MTISILLFSGQKIFYAPETWIILAIIYYGISYKKLSKKAKLIGVFSIVALIVFGISSLQEFSFIKLDNKVEDAFTSKRDANSSTIDPQAEKLRKADDLITIKRKIMDNREYAGSIEGVLGKPDRQGAYDNYSNNYSFDYITYAVYYDKVKTENGLQNLVLIAHNSDITGIFALSDGGMVNAGKEGTYIIVNRNNIEHNENFTFGGEKYQKFNTTRKFGTYR